MMVTRIKRFLTLEEHALLMVDEGVTNIAGMNENSTLQFKGHTGLFLAALSDPSLKTEDGWIQKRSLLQKDVFARLGKINASKAFKRWMDEFNAKAAKAPEVFGKIRCPGGGGPQTGPYRWDCPLQIVVSSSAQTALNASILSDARERIPRHYVPELRLFVTEMLKAMRFFHESAFSDAEQLLTDILERSFTGPRYRYKALAGDWLFQTLHRQGNEKAAKEVLNQVDEYILQIDPPDNILKATASYNYAWLSVSEVDAARRWKTFEAASRELEAASPDDARWGYLLGIQGRHTIRKFQGVRQRSLTTELRQLALDAIQLFAHSVFLLLRAEDFWKLQEACWNVADALFIASTAHRTKAALDFDAVDVGVSLDEIYAWIDLSDNICRDDTPAVDSIRNEVLRARISLLIVKDYEGALGLLQGALEGGKYSNPKEKGRIYQLMVDALLYLERPREAWRMLNQAERHWANYEQWIKDLERCYKKEAGTKISWKEKKPILLR